MSKALIKEAVGILPGGHEYDMRPRYDRDTYIEILRLAKETGVKPNVLIRIMTKMQLGLMRDEGREAVVKTIIRFQQQN